MYTDEPFAIQGFKTNSLHIQAEHLDHVQRNKSKPFLFSNT